MPKILINEKDLTSPGASGDYSNYAVLLVGFAKEDATLATLKESVEKRAKTKNDVHVDDNNVFEFSSQSAFLEIIGKRSPKLSDNSTTEHYGNQMAYELLGLGYTVLYRPVFSIAEFAGSTDVDAAEFWEVFKDKANYDFRFISHGLLCSSDEVTTGDINRANCYIADLAAYHNDNGVERLGRGDCIALVEIDEGFYTDLSSGKKPEILIAEATEKIGLDIYNGKYCAITVPSVVYDMADDEEFDSNTKFPGAFHYLACFANMLGSGFREWYAAAGYTRGVSKYKIDHTSVKLGEIAINALEPRCKTGNGTEPAFACNVIANFRGSYYLWGNRTAFPLHSKDDQKYGDLTASCFLNIRHLCATVKKQLYVACRRYTFDPNSDTLWFNFVNAIKPTLEAMKADQGVRDYRIMKVPTDKKATLKAKIRIIPIEAVEDFDLEVSLEDSFGETTTVVTE